MMALDPLISIRPSGGATSTSCMPLAASRLPVNPLFPMSLPLRTNDTSLTSRIPSWLRRMPSFIFLGLFDALAGAIGGLPVAIEFGAADFGVLPIPPPVGFEFIEMSLETNEDSASVPRAVELDPDGCFRWRRAFLGGIAA